MNHIFVGEMTNGIRNGYGEIYIRKTGLRFFEGHFKDGEHNGFCKFYYKDYPDNQVLEKICYMRNGHPHGPYWQYKTNGKLSYREYWKDSEPDYDSLRVEYTSDGQIDFDETVFES